ncbi:uncharacterized protein LOC128741664 [Sabethes cyaneus]|uniref:uncharacterized protein LOC128741664 n=1 Tax=Sabethes cyaneus TaxID=53552 RepID=UPI00237E813F|nr:uncharacterized protein LOC128741664 [Sabethes cyaneus]
MDTDKLNRELQIFRNHVKICRENVIHKLVRDIKFWKAKQETQSDNNNQRANKKVQSLEATFEFIRTQSASELAKAVIKFNPKQDAASTVEHRALMRFHENKKLHPEIKALIRRFGLKSKMDVLDKYLKGPAGCAKKGKQQKRKKKNEKKKKKETEQDSEDQGFCEVGEKSESDEEIASDEDSVSGGMAEGDGKFVKVAKATVETSNSKKLKRKSDKSRSKTVKIKKVFIAPDEEDDDEEKCVKIQDSFFVTSSGQSYVATAPVVDSKELEKEELSWKRAVKRKDIFGRKEEEPSKQNKTDDLHPSWKAKQQQKGIAAFEGKRKRFGDDSVKTTTKSASDMHPSWVAKQQQRTLQPFQGKKTKFDPVESVKSEQTDPNLHPSWAAKQKQKGIKSFAGTKIVFDSIEPIAAGTNKSLAKSKPVQVTEAQPADVHPSWAAKQKEKGIKEFQGKKITFDD